MINGMMLQAFEWDLPADGQHWNRIKRKAALWAHLGITSVWLPPAYKGAAGGADVGYGAYDLYDLGEFDQKGSVRTKYGTAEEYMAAVRALKLSGIQVLADAVMNHRMGADEKEETTARWVNPDNRNEISPQEEPAVVYTRFTFPGRGGRYSDFEWTHSCFSAVDWNDLDPAHHLFLLDGKQWQRDVDGEKGNYDYLMGADVDTDAPYVREELIRWGKWYRQRVGFDGFRLDAVKHISAGFCRDWLKALRADGDEIYAVGEYWSGSLPALENYLNETGFAMDLFDVPLHAQFHAISRGNGDFDMRTLFRDTLTAAHPQQSVTFVDNHDTQPGQSLESWTEGWFKASAYGLILLRKEGYPCVFWGDLYGIPEKRIAPVAELPVLMRLRMKCAYGEERDYFDHPDIAGFVREGEPGVPGSGLAFLCSDGPGGTKRMCVGRRFAGQTFRCVLGGHPDVTIGSDGTAEFAVGGGGCSVYVPKPGLLTILWRLWKDVCIFLRRRAAGRGRAGQKSR